MQVQNQASTDNRSRFKSLNKWNKR